jgi:hypothetical protein
MVPKFTTPEGGKVYGPPYTKAEARLLSAATLHQRGYRLFQIHVRPFARAQQ